MNICSKWENTRHFPYSSFIYFWDWNVINANLLSNGRHLVVVSRCYGNAASLLLSHVAMVTTVVLYVTYACLWRYVISCLTICRLRGDVTFLCSDPQSNRNQRRCHVNNILCPFLSPYILTISALICCNEEAKYATWKVVHIKYC